MLSARDAGRLGEWIGARVNVQMTGGETIPGTLVSVGLMLTLEWEGKTSAINWDCITHVWVRINEG